MMTHIENLKVLLAAIETTPDDSIDLSIWHCGTLHCIGGMLPHIEHFAQQGVVAGKEGAPARDPDSVLCDHELLDDLFGRYRGKFDEPAFRVIFAPHGTGVWDMQLGYKLLTDKQLAVARLRQAIAQKEAA